VESRFFLSALEGVRIIGLQITRFQIKHELIIRANID
jgi:hypothetical protein